MIKKLKNKIQFKMKSKTENLSQFKFLSKFFSECSFELFSYLLEAKEKPKTKCKRHMYIFKYNVCVGNIFRENEYFHCKLCQYGLNFSIFFTFKKITHTR